jgi:hypothetical protein
MLWPWMWGGRFFSISLSRALTHIRPDTNTNTAGLCDIEAHQQKMSIALDVDEEGTVLLSIAFEKQVGTHTNTHTHTHTHTRKHIGA